MEELFFSHPDQFNDNMDYLINILKKLNINTIYPLENCEPTPYYSIKFCKRNDFDKFMHIIFTDTSTKKYTIKNKWKIEISIWDEIYQNGKIDTKNSPIIIKYPKNDHIWILQLFVSIMN